ncbi:trypsin-like peptidase domain-containing protein [Streptomyces sp. KR80]|uniref:trypsin-like peptidase domain-containing protein n=1 Tax=Streptomyces sp. KR80 TaxID=3457426 RepID=UPI003FD5738F
MAVRTADAAAALVRICDLAGRPRGTGFLADDLGTLLTSHEAVDGLARLVLHAPGGRVCLVEADAITALPESDLALVRTEDLGVPPLAVAPADAAAPGTRVRLRARGWLDARVSAVADAVTYTATDRFHLLGEALELAIDVADRADGEALRLGGRATGGPVLDAETGAVLAVIGTALHADHRAAAFAVPPGAAAAAEPGGPLAELLARNAATVPAYGRALNLAGALQLTATSVGRADGPRTSPEPVERPATAAEFDAFLRSSDPVHARVLALVGEPGVGRTTELRALAARRARGAEPAPTVWLCGADLKPGDCGVADAVERVLQAAARVVAASAEGTGFVGALPGEDGDIVTPDRIAGLARDAGRPLLVLLDAAEEMPQALAERLPAWTAETTDWLEDAGARLIVACRPEHWERVAGMFPASMRHRPDPAGEEDCVRLGDLTPGEAERARARYEIPDGALEEQDAAHPLALRLLAEVHAAMPEGPEAGGRPGRAEIFAAHLDLMCLRIAVRLAAADRPPRATAVRRLAARVAGRVHEAARRCLGTGQGELDRQTFEELFPWRTGWASAVLTEGLIVPSGDGYRFAHEECADWIQGAHLDLDAALHALVHRWYEAAETDAPVGPPVGPASRGDGQDAAEPPARGRTRGRDGGGPATSKPGPGEGRERGEPTPSDSGSAPRYRLGPVLQALLLLERRSGPEELACRLKDLAHAVDALAARRGAEGGLQDAPTHGRRDNVLASGTEGERAGSDAADSSATAIPAASDAGDAAWWAARLLRETLLRVPDIRPYLGVLRFLAERIAERSVCAGGIDPAGLEGFLPWFWMRLPLDTADRLDLLRLLLPADSPPAQDAARPRFIDAAGDLLRAEPETVQPLLCRWFTDDRPLQTAPDGDPGLRPTVAAAAQALLHTHRQRAVDDLTEALVAAAHPRADELLVDLAEDETSALCRAVDRWAHDRRTERHVAAASLALRTAPHVRTDADRELLRYAALALLDRPADCSLHGAALALLVRDPESRHRHLPHAVARFAAQDPHLPPSALAVALPTHPEPVLAAFQARLHAPEGEPGRGKPTGTGGAGEVLRTLADVTTPALARRAAALVRDYVERHPDGAQHAAAYVDRRLEHGPSARSVLFPLVAGLLREQPPQVRRALAPVLAAPGTRISRPLRQELLEVLLEHEQYGRQGRDDPSVLEALLRAAAHGAALRHEAHTRELVHRTGLLLVRTPEGAACFDRRLVELARRLPGFARQVRRWLESAPREWAAIVGPSALRMLDIPPDAPRAPRRPRGEASGLPADSVAPDDSDVCDVPEVSDADASGRHPAWQS